VTTRAYTQCLKDQAPGVVEKICARAKAISQELYRRQSHEDMPMEVDIAAISDPRAKLKYIPDSDDEGVP
jgi:hypothetical protein